MYYCSRNNNTNNNSNLYYLYVYMYVCFFVCPLLSGFRVLNAALSNLAQVLDGSLR